MEVRQLAIESADHGLATRQGDAQIVRELLRVGSMIQETDARAVDDVVDMAQGGFDCQKLADQSTESEICILIFRLEAPQRGHTLCYDIGNVDDGTDKTKY